jgi:hypothetical protein
MDVLMPSLLGFAVTAIILFLIIRNLEAVIFWSALCAPAIGTSLINALTYAIGGNYEQAKASLSLLPFFMASLDNVFFAQEDPLYMYVGVVFVLIWAYIIAHYAVKKFGMWALPIIPAMIWGIGLTMSHMRERLMTNFPNFAFLFDFYGLPALILATSAVFSICYLIWRKGYSLQRLPMWMPSK